MVPAAPAAIDVTEYRGLVVYLARRVRRPSTLDFDDLVSEGMLALVRAARMFDPARGKRFANYAGAAVRRSLWRLASAYWLARELPQTLAAPARDHSADADEVAALLAPLPRRQRQAVTLRFGLDGEGKRSLRAAAERMGVSCETVRLDLKAALARLRGER